MIEKTAEDSMLGAREKGICYFWFLGLSPTKKISKNIFINIQVGKVTNVSSESSVTSLVEPRILF